MSGPHSLVGKARAAASFTSTLYADRARHAYAGWRGNLPSQLRGRAGRIDPYPVYERIRADGPFVRNRFGNFATVDHALCDEILRSRRFGVRPERAAYEPETAPETILNLNPPDHTRLRKIAAPAFGPRAMAAYRPMIERRIHALVDHAERLGEFDFVDAIGAPLPIAVITALLDIPGEHEAEFRRYGEAIGGALAGIRGVRHAAQLSRAERALDALFAELVEERRTTPGDDVISRMVAAEGEQRIHAAEITPMCQLLLVAGFETTVNALGNGVLAFQRFPEQWQRLVAEPGLAGTAAEEILRYDSSVQRTFRISFDDNEVAGQPIRRNQGVQILIGGANRDPAVFAEPDRFDLDRPNAAGHLAFSSGVHYCLGQPLARLELTVAFEVMAQRLPRLRCTGRVRYRPSTLLRGPARLPVAVS